MKEILLNMLKDKRTIIMIAALAFVGTLIATKSIKAEDALKYLGPVMHLLME